MRSSAENRQIIAGNIRRYMEAKGITNQRLCDDLDFKYTTFLDWIKGNTYPRIEKIEAMANYFGCSKSDLIETSPSPPSAFSPSPLSLEELLTRKGEPVWIRLENNSYQFSGWAIVFELSSGGVFLQFNAGCEQLPISEYTRTWVAFDHKPDMTVHEATGQGQPFLDKLRSLGQIPDIGPVSIKIPSDYDPNTFLRLTRTDDGDVIFKIVGSGEMRIATSGGYLHGMDLVTVTNALGKVMEVYKRKDENDLEQEPIWEYRKYIRTGLLSPSGEFIALNEERSLQDVYYDYIIDRYQYPSSLKKWREHEDDSLIVIYLEKCGWVFMCEVMSNKGPEQQIYFRKKLTQEQQKFLTPYFEYRHNMPPLTDGSRECWHDYRNYT